MKSFIAKVALSVVGVVLFTTAYAQMPDNAVRSSHRGVMHHRVHHANAGYDRHAYHTGSAYRTGAIYNQAAPYGSANAADVAAGAGSQDQPLYNAAVQPIFDQAGVACVGGTGVGQYPNPIAYDDSAATIESGGQFILERGYTGCFTHIGE